MKAGQTGRPFRPGLTSWWLTTAVQDCCKGPRRRKGQTWISSQRGLPITSAGNPWNSRERPHEVTSELLSLSSKPGRGEGRSLSLFIWDGPMPKAARKECHLQSLRNIYHNHSTEEVCKDCFSSLWLMEVRGRISMPCKN